MGRIHIANQGHVVSVLPPVSGTASGVVFSMKNYSHASIIITQGVAASASTISVSRVPAFGSGGTGTAIAFDYYLEATSGGDTLAGKVLATAGGVALTSGSNQILVIEIDDDELITSCPNLCLEMSSANSLISAVAILSGARYASDQSPTVIA
jgi:hypothetical protein